MKKKVSREFRFAVLSLIISALFLIPDAKAMMVRNERGQSVALESVLGKDSLLVFGFNRCSHLCDFVVQNMTKRLATFKHHPGVVFLSLAHEEGPADSFSMKRKIKGPEKDHWTFVTANEQDIKDITKKLSFSWKRDPVSGDITHEAAIFLTKDGEVMRKLPGLDLKEKDLDLTRPAGKFFDFKQFCSAFDPGRSKYGSLIMKTLSYSSLLFMVFAGGAWIRLRRKETKR